MRTADGGQLALSSGSNAEKVAQWRQRRREEVRAQTQRELSLLPSSRSPSPIDQRLRLKMGNMDQEEAAIKIQSRVRGNQARAQMSGQRQESWDNCVRIEETPQRCPQCGNHFMRDAIYCRRCGRRRGGEEEDEAATKIQARFRGRRARKEVKVMKKSGRGGRRPQTEEDQAATKIQASFRGKKARADLRGRRQPRRRPDHQAGAPAKNAKIAGQTRARAPDGLDDEKAATKIQASFRGKKARAEVKTRKAANRVSPAKSDRHLSKQRSDLNTKSSSTRQRSDRARATGAAAQRDRSAPPRAKAAARADSRSNLARGDSETNSRQGDSRNLARGGDSQNSAKADSRNLARADSRSNVKRADSRPAMSRTDSRTAITSRSRTPAQKKRGDTTGQQPTRKKPSATSAAPSRRGSTADAASSSAQQRQEEDVATVKIQCASQEDQAAVKIQASFRGNSARKEVRKKKEHREREQAAIKIQSTHRGKRDRLLYDKRRREGKKVSEIELMREELKQVEKELARAEVMRQRRADLKLRGKSQTPARKGNSPIDKQLLADQELLDDGKPMPEFIVGAEEAAATTIQARYRGSKVRKDLRSQGGNGSSRRAVSPLKYAADKDDWWERVEYTQKYINDLRQQRGMSRSGAGALNRGAHQPRNVHRSMPPREASTGTSTGSRTRAPHSGEQPRAGRAKSPESRRGPSPVTPQRKVKDISLSPAAAGKKIPADAAKEEDAERSKMVAPRTPRSEQEKSQMLAKFRIHLVKKFGSAQKAAASMDFLPGGAVTVQELEYYLQNQMHQPEPRAQAIRLFQAMDKDGDSKLPVQEMHESLEAAYAKSGKTVEAALAGYPAKGQKQPRGPKQPQSARGAKQGGLRGGAKTPPPPARVEEPPPDTAPLNSTAPARLATSTPALPRQNVSTSNPPAKGPSVQGGVKVAPGGLETAPDGNTQDLDALNGQYLGFRNPVGQREGFGVLRGKDGTTYTGQWVHGRREGHGTLFFNGGVFEGTWTNGNAHGKGSVYFKNGDNFVGSYQANRKHGHGMYHWADGAEESGEYHQGVKNGWHHWKRGGEQWDLLYENGTVAAARRIGESGKMEPTEPPGHVTQRGSQLPKMASLNLLEVAKASNPRGSKSTQAGEGGAAKRSSQSQPAKKTVSERKSVHSSGKPKA